MSTAVTWCPAAARARAVHPAPAMQKTRLRGLKACSSMPESSYVCPKLSWRNCALKGPCRHGVAAVSGVRSITAILRGNPNKHQESEVLHDHSPRIGNQMPGPNQSAAIHCCKQCGLHDCGLTHPLS